MIDKTEVSAFVKEVRKWVGDSPVKASIFGASAFVLGGFWGGWFSFWPL